VIEPGERLRFGCTAHGSLAASQRRLGRLFAALGAALLGAAVFAILTRQVGAGAVALVLAFGVFVIHRMSRELDPAELVVEDRTLLILMRHALRRLPLADSSARRLDGAEIDHLTGLTSSGGFAAGAGGFDSHILGEFDLYASRLENAVLIETADGRVIVTPDRPDEFVAAVRAAAA